MKRLQSAAFVVVLGLVSAVPIVAHAFAKVELVWTATTGSGTPGSKMITASPGDQLTGEIRVTPDATGVLAYGVSLLFDIDGSNELDLIDATENLPPGMEFNLSSGVGSTQESTTTTPGSVLTLEAVCLNCDGPASGTIVAGTVTFQVTGNVANDGDDVLTGEFNAMDGLSNNALLPIENPVFVNASVNAGPLEVPALPEAGLIVASATILLGALWMLGRGRFALRT